MVVTFWRGGRREVEPAGWAGEDKEGVGLRRFAIVLAWVM